jgi:glutathione peroxidase
MKNLIFNIILITIGGILLMNFSNSQNQSAYDFSFENIIQGGKEIKLSDFENKLIMIINTASECGFTKQYQAIEEIWQKYRDKGLIVIAVPSNDFGGQEPGDNEQVAKFIKEKYNGSFYITAKQHVSGDKPHEFFTWFNTQKGWLSKPKWNFYKYFISPQGEALTWFSSMTEPNSAKIIETIENNLPIYKKESSANE